MNLQTPMELIRRDEVLTFLTASVSLACIGDIARGIELGPLQSRSHTEDDGPKI